MKTLGILTRDCAGINAVIRAVVRVAAHYGIDVLGIQGGYEGLISGEIRPLDRLSVSGIVNRGGTVLKTFRSSAFLSRKGQNRAVRTVEKYGIEGLIVVGGNGSMKGAHVLASRHGVPTIGIPATIDNDINGVDLSVGADTAVNVAVDALDKIRDTATSLERVFVVEVMGRHCGYIALQVALAGGCEEVLLPERDFDMEKMCEEIKEGNVQGKVSWIVIVAEGKAKAQDIGESIIKKTGLETRITVLGHIQRGGSPTALDRNMAARLGAYAVEQIRRGETDVCVHLNNGNPGTVPLEIAVRPKKLKVEPYYKLIKVLT
jgi:6-phosphofructokinase 1